MPKERSGLASAADRSDYDAGGDGLLGSRRFRDVDDLNDFFGVKYTNDNYWSGGYDHDGSYGDFSDWYETATPEERAAVVSYTGWKYDTINKYLRNQDMDNAPDWVKEAVRNIDKTTKKFNLKEAITVWRGGSNKLIGGARTLEEVNAMKGAVVMDRGITSTAATKTASFVSDHKMAYEIVYPKGRGRGVFADPISDNHGEQEFMAARNTQYEVLGGYKDEKGRVVCRLKAIYPKKSRKKA